MSKKDREKTMKMRVSFDLDEVLFVSPADCETEPPLPFPLNHIFPDRLRRGTRYLIKDLQLQGFEVWIYTSSFRSERYIRTLFRLYGLSLDGVVNAQRHQREVQAGHKEIKPSKLPCHYYISLHVDDEALVASYGRKYGFNVYQLHTRDRDWALKVMDRAREIRLRRQGR